MERQTGSELEVIETTEKELLRAEQLPADAVLCPAHLLGVLAERKQIAPVPERSRTVPNGPASSVCSSCARPSGAIRPMAVPFGSPVFCCYYRADLLEKLGRRPPKTWDEYQDVGQVAREKLPAREHG